MKPNKPFIKTTIRAHAPLEIEITRSIFMAVSKPKPIKVQWLHKDFKAWSIGETVLIVAHSC